MRLFPCLTILIIYSCNPPVAPSLQDDKMDSIINSFRSHIDPDLKQDRFTSVVSFLDSVGPSILAMKDHRANSSWFALKGLTYVQSTRFDSALYYGMKALQSAQQINDSNKYLIEAQYILMNAFAGLTRYDSAVKYGLDAYYLGQIFAYRVGEINSSLSDVYAALGDTVNRRKYLLEGYQIATDPTIRLDLANGLAKYYFDMGEMDSVKKFYSRLINDSLINSIEVNAIVNQSNLGIILSMDGQLMEGLKHFKEAIELMKRYSLLEEGPYMNCGENYSRLGHFNLSNSYIDSAIFITKSKNNFQLTALLYRSMSDNFIQLQQSLMAYKALDSALHYYQKKDSAAYLEKIQDLETRYAVKEKDEQIGALAYSNAVGLKIRKQQQIIVVVIGVAFVLLMGLGWLLWRRRQLTTQLREAEFHQQLLRGKMEPHFIFNTLSALRGFVNSGATQKAADYILKLSQLLRLNFDNAHQSLVPLTEEVKFIETYLSLQQEQMDGNFDYCLTVYPGYESEEILVPPMVLQPFIENALLHGFDNISYQGHLVIDIMRKEDILSILIEDNGKGLRGAAENVVATNHALSIIKQRLDLISRKMKKDVAIVMEDKRPDETGSGVRIKLDIPIIQQF